MHSPTSSSPHLSDADPEILKDIDKLRSEQHGLGHTLDGLVEQIDDPAGKQYIRVPVGESVKCSCVWEVLHDGLLNCELRAPCA